MKATAKTKLNRNNQFFTFTAKDLEEAKYNNKIFF